MKKKRNKLMTLLTCRYVWLCMALVCAQLGYAALDVTRLRVEALENPVGIDAETPRFSWMLKADGRGVKQSAYSVQVYAHEEGGDEVWSSGKIDSQQSIDIPYAGTVLLPSTRYYWKVTVWDNQGNKTTSSKAAYFETGLMGTGWDGAKWIKATSIPKEHTGGIDPLSVTNYSVSVDFEIKNIAAGICFGQKDATSYYMWQINLEAGYPRFRPHSWNAGKAVCHANIDLRNMINVQKDKVYRLRIEVDGDVAKTYIDEVLIDTRTNPLGGNYGYGGAGIRQDRAEANSSIPEEAYFDNFRITDRTESEEKLLFSEDFSDAEAFLFSTGTVEDGRLYVAAEYSWVNTNKAVSYDIDLDMILVRDNAGIIFSAYDTKNMHLWSINARDKANPILRRHVFTNGAYVSSDVDLGAFINKQELLNKKHPVKIAVRNKTIRTYIDGNLVDTYQDASSGLHNGFIGFRAYRGDGMDELVYYDNVKITTYDPESATPESGQVTFSEDFEEASCQFVDGEVTESEGNRMLKVHSQYQENCILQNTSQGIPMLRKEFKATAAVKSAKLYSTALGVYDVFINGARVGNILPDGTTQYDELKPGWTDYFKEIFYMSYDVTPLIVQGDNAIGAHLGTGWWGGAIAHGIYGSPSLGFMAKLVLEYEDGNKEVVVTDVSWSASSSAGPVLRGDIYDGESYDARKECAWASPGFDDSRWCRTDLNTEFNGKISAYSGPMVRVREELRRMPQSITVYEGAKSSGTAYGMVDVVETRTGSGKLVLKKGQTAVYDMGQNMVGWVKFTATGQAGAQLKFRFGEMLNDKGDTGRGDDGPGGSVYTYNLRTAKATLNYILKGDAEGETFQPSTTFFGFRYCEVTATQDVEIAALTGEVVGSVIEEGSSFSTSHPDVNQLYSNVMWSQRGNFLSVPTDCPQRDERLGWTGDTQIFSRAAIYNADVRAFYHKWMMDMRNSQRADGAYPDIAPYCWFGFGNAAWGDAGIIVPWTVYLMYGDKSILEDNYESMTRYMNFLSAQKGDGYQYNGPGTSFGDWIAYEDTDSRFVSVCYYAYVAQLMEKIAEAMSTGGDLYALEAEKYGKLYGNIKEEFQKRYLLSNGMLKVSSQTSYLLALKMDLFPDEETRTKAVATLRQKLVSNGYKLSTGFVGTGILNQTLSQYGQDDMAYNLLLQRNNPSWLYSIDQGATTIWERWDSYTKEKGFNDHPWIMNSFNHYSYGVVSEWMFRYVGGIEADEKNPGFKHFILQPTPDNRTTFPQGQERITWAKASFYSYYGDIVSHWSRKEDGRIGYQATVPVNTTATLYLPVLSEADAIYEGDGPAADSEGVEYVGMEEGCAVFRLQSGTYSFDVRSSIPDGLSRVFTEFTVCPNPVVDFLNVTCEEEVKEIFVVNADGQMVHKQSQNTPIRVSSWNTGFYFVQVLTPQNSYIARVMKE